MKAWGAFSLQDEFVRGNIVFVFYYVVDLECFGSRVF